MNYASINNTIIEALLTNSFKFPNRENGRKFLEKLREKFILAKNSGELIGQDKLRFWIKGYKITPEEQKNGVLGNYCVVTLQDAADGTCRVIAEKEVVEVAQHPSRKRKQARMPNYGHPALRLAKKSAEFDKFTKAAEILLDLHNEFPETTIPGKDKLDLMVYSRDGKNKPKTDKIRLSIKPSGERFVLAIEQKAMPEQKKEELKNDAIKGKYTAMALMKKKKK
jgi:hypothetical protein